MRNTQPQAVNPVQNLGLNTQIIQLNFRIKLLNNQIQSLQDELNQAKEGLGEAKSDLIKKERKAKDEQSYYEYQINDLQEKLNHKQSVIDSVESKLKEAQRKNDELQQQIEFQKNQICELENKQDEAKNKETFQNKQKKFIAQLEQQYQELQKTSEQKEQEICLLRTEKLSMKEEMLKQNFQNENYRREFNLDLMEKKAQIDIEHKNFLECREEMVTLRKEIEKFKQDNKTLDQEKYNLYNNLQTQIDINRVLQNKLKQCEDRVVYKKQKLKIAKENIAFQENFLRNQINNNQRQAINRDLQQNMEEFWKKQQKMQEELKKQFEQQHAENQKSMIQLNQQILNGQKQQAAEQQKLLQQGVQLGTKRISQAMQTHGKLDVCFLLDVTGSMDPYKEQTKNCIQQSLQMIKNACNRDTYWGGICYQDFEEFRKLGKYQQFLFSEQSDELQQWLQKIKCEGGGDEPEDIRGAMKQMCSLKWPSKFKLAILICDSPCHGRRFTGGLGDNYPNEDIEDAIDLLIKQNIILVGLNFTQKTILMYQEFQKIYQARGKSELFIYADLQRVRIEDVAAQMSKWIADASTHATFTNKKGTKHNLRDLPAFQNGPTEALFNQKQYLNCLNFDKNTKSLNVRFKVLKVEIKEAVFELKIQQLYDINFPQDYLITEEGQWDCIRTEKPFAQGAMKDAFLMKRAVSPNIDLYVVKAQKNKGPYRSINDAIMECRSHLICQRLMKKFQNDLERALQNKGIHKKYPAVIYSDILILEESNNKYWIAERFFNGEFVKYNNNWSYIDESVTELNKIAQSFSYYTFHMSKQNYIVVDVQGVGIYFTDPAIHTKIGHFELTDMGEEGISMYLVSYKKIAQTVSREILQIMDIFAI